MMGLALLLMTLTIDTEALNTPLTLHTENGTAIYAIGNTNGTCSGTCLIQIDIPINTTMSECKQYLTCENPKINYQELQANLENTTYFQMCGANLNNATLSLALSDAKIQMFEQKEINWMTEKSKLTQELTNSGNEKMWYLIAAVVMTGFCVFMGFGGNIFKGGEGGVTFG